MAIIGFDIDDTVADGMSVFIPEQNKFFKTNIKIEEIGQALVNYKIYEIYNTTPEIFDKYIYDSGPFLLPTLKPIKGFVDLVNKLYNEGHIIYFVTARPEENTKELTLNWLKSNGFKFHGVYHSKTKVEICKKLGIQVFIDDHPIIINNLNKAGIVCILADVPKNKYIEVDNDIYRSSSAENIYKIITNLISEGSI